MVPLDLSRYADRLHLRRHAGKAQIRCAIRRRWVARTPEEVVRQLMLEALVTWGFPKGRIAVEQQIRVHGRFKRVDVLVYDAHSTPWMLVECKAPAIELSDRTFAQAAWYNMALRAPWLVITNGLETRCAQVDHRSSKWTLTDRLPKPPPR